MLYLRGGDDQAKSDWWSWNCARGYQVTQVLSYYLMIILPKKEEKRKRVNCMKSKKCLTLISLIQCVAMISILFGSKHLSNFNLFFYFTRFRLAGFFFAFTRFGLAGFWSFEENIWGLFFSAGEREREGISAGISIIRYIGAMFSFN